MAASSSSVTLDDDRSSITMASLSQPSDQVLKQFSKKRRKSRRLTLPKKKARPASGPTLEDEFDKMQKVACAKFPIRHEDNNTIYWHIFFVGEE